jgi:cyclase
MLKKRVIGVVTIKNGWAVQSFGYRQYLPLGTPECLVENLDRWGADEILVQVIDRSATNLGPDFELLERLGGLGLETPLIYAGGIRSESDGVKVIQLGADRVAVDTLLHDDLSSIRRLSDRLGAQALIASMPLSWQEGTIQWLNYRQRNTTPIPLDMLRIIESGVISEVLVTDWMHEGKPGAFDQNIVANFPLRDAPLIAFGGLSTAGPMAMLLQQSNVNAIAVGNFLSYKEHSIQKFKELLVGMPVRLAIYESKWSLLADV